MSSKSKRRPIRPHERARVDQAMAAARERAVREPTTGLFVVEYADPGIQCCWCDCSLEQHIESDSRNCGGCPSDAIYIVHVLIGTPSMNYPMCERHRWGIAELYRERLGIQHDIEIIGYNAYDDDIG